MSCCQTWKWKGCYNNTSSWLPLVFLQTIRPEIGIVSFQTAKKRQEFLLSLFMPLGSARVHRNVRKAVNLWFADGANSFGIGRPGCRGCFNHRKNSLGLYTDSTSRGFLYGWGKIGFILIGKFRDRPGCGGGSGHKKGREST